MKLLEKLKSMKKGTKIILALVILGAIGSMFMQEESADNMSVSNIEQQENEAKEPSLTKEELLSKLEGYEILINNHLEGFAKVAETGDNEKMKQLFKETSTAAEATRGLLSDTIKEYNSETNEYKAINELKTAFNSLKDACNAGVKYIDSNEEKYLNKYENNIDQVNIFVDRFNEVKSNIK